MLRRFLLATIGSIVLGGAAVAADLPAPRRRSIWFPFGSSSGPAFISAVRLAMARAFPL